MRRQLWILSNIFLLGLPWVYRKMFPSSTDDRIHLSVTVILDPWNYSLKSLFDQMPKNDQVLDTAIGFQEYIKRLQGRSWSQSSVPCVFHLIVKESELMILEKINGITLTIDEHVYLGGEFRRSVDRFYKCPTCKGKYTYHSIEWDDDDNFLECSECDEGNESIEDHEDGHLGQFDLPKLKKLLAQGKVVVPE